ncbi:MAG: AhpC/TSA family protein [Taibaiella sp.]|nr:AhpC/TSA family protein [Taibaiella sp.]
MRSRHIHLSFLVLVVLFASCKNWSNKFTVVGEISGLPEQKVMLEELSVNDVITVIDSTRSKANGKFELNGDAAEPGLYRLHFGENQYILLAIDKGNIKITGNWNALTNYHVEGSSASENLHRFITAIDEHLRDFNTMSMVLDTLQKRGNDSLLTVAKKEFSEMRFSFTRFVEQYADTTKSEPNAIFAARILNMRTEKVFLNAFTQSLTRRFPNTKMTKDFEMYYNQISATTNTPPAAMDGPMVGSVAPAINLATPDGKMVSLASMKGKYVLLDFWASWCGPCRGENPNVVAAYNKYKGKNFTVYSVSLDDKKDKWLQAIKADGLTWTHVSDLNGWESAPVRVYNIQSIPSNFLLDTTGRVIARDLRGDMLEAKLAEVLGK